ncbi:hypothetical protein [Streptomyces sp. AV19]|uniref:hypothetical protein n=1 Tax=Streptomyces sp. AV19 TaxID=2793068 RepID=UPI002412F9F0|nr:hypothetical protein [Streptomyces sp. AV19]MDG4534255.1 hypothetical protein [Streptomyces sp. AV19]
MLRHVIAPASRFTQVPNDIIRHPRLSPDARCLLLWLLSVPDTASVSFSEAASRAGIRNAAFQRAKTQLKEEGYAHEWRSQGPDGRWATTQLVASQPLSADEARAIRDGRPAPTAVKPAVGEPTPRPVGRHPKTNTVSNTSPPPVPPTPRELIPDELVEYAALVLASVSHSERQLRLTGREIKELAPLAADWILRGATGRDLREELRNGLPEPVHHAASLIRDRLLRKLPEAPPIPAKRPAPLEPRIAQMRECEGDHTHPYLFRPLGGETLCGECRIERAGQTARGRTAAVEGTATT